MESNKKTSQNWYLKNWEEKYEQCKLLEKSMGLSFLQNYTGEEDETEVTSEPQPPGPELKPEPPPAKEMKMSVQTQKNTVDCKTASSDEELKKQKNKAGESKKNKMHKVKEDDGESKKKKSKKTKEKKREKQVKSKKVKNKKSPKEKKRKERKNDKKDKPLKSNRDSNSTEIKERDFDRVEEERKNLKRKLSENKDKSKKAKYDRGLNNTEPRIISSSKVVKVEHFPEDFHHTSENKRSFRDKSFRKKSRWSQLDLNSEAEADFIATAAAVLSSPGLAKKRKHSQKNQDEQREKTPDTDEYHSLWESDDEVAVPIPPRQSIKMNRTWESDEELFDRSQKAVKKRSTSPSYSSLEIPLNIKTFSRRTEAPAVTENLCVDDKIKMLEKERRFVLF